MLRRKKGQHSSVSPSQESSNNETSQSPKELPLEAKHVHDISGNDVSHNQRALPSPIIGNRNRNGSTAWRVGTLLMFCAASWLALRRNHHDANDASNQHHLILPSHPPPTRVFSKWDGAVVDLMPAIHQYFHVSSLQGNFSAFQRLYVVHDDGLYVADLAPHNPVNRMIGERANLTEPLLAKLARDKKLRNGAVYLVNYEDSRFCLDETLFHDVTNGGRPVRKVPILTPSRPTHCNHAFPMVTYESIRLASTRANATAAMALETSPPPPWMARDKRVVWRGSPTGKVRIELGTFVQNFTDLFDYQLTWFLLTGKKGKEFVGLDELPNYRAVLDVDGASWSSRFASLLCLPTVVLKYNPLDVDYFFDELRPSVHYISVTDTTDLLEKARFVQDDGNAAEIAEIIRNANEWCHRRLELSEIELDMTSILLDYSRYQEPIDTAKLMSTQNFTKVSSG